MRIKFKKLGYESILIGGMDAGIKKWVISIQSFLTWCRILTLFWRVSKLENCISLAIDRLEYSCYPKSQYKLNRP